MNDRCRVAERWIHLVLDGEASPETERELDEHLDGCESCRSLYESRREELQVLDTELSGLGTLFDAAKGVDPEQLDRKPPKSRLQLLSLRSLGLGLAVVAVAAVSYFFIASTPGSDAVVVAHFVPIRIAREGVRIERPARDAVTTSAGAALHSGDRVEVGAGSAISVTRLDGVRMTVEGPARFGFPTDASSGRIDCLSGDYRIDFPGQDLPNSAEPGLQLEGDDAHRVVSPWAVVVSDRCRFDLLLAESRAEIVMLSGTAEVERRNSDSRVRVTTGERAIVGRRSIQVRNLAPRGDQASDHSPMRNSTRAESPDGGSGTTGKSRAGVPSSGDVEGSRSAQPGQSGLDLPPTSAPRRSEDPVLDLPPRPIGGG